MTGKQNDTEKQYGSFAAIDKETAERLEKKIDRLLDIVPNVEALSRILIRRRTAQRSGVTGSTIDRNDRVRKYEEIGHERTFIEIGDVQVIQRRVKRKRKK